MYARSMLPAFTTGMPVVFPTLTGRERGVFWQTSASNQCLVLFPGPPDKSPPLRETLFRLCQYGQMAGVNVLEILGSSEEKLEAQNDNGADAPPPDQDAGSPLAISLLATLTYLRSRKINHVAIIYAFDVSVLLRLHDLVPYLLMQGLGATHATSALITNIAEFTRQLKLIGDMTQSAAQSIAGIACLRSHDLVEDDVYISPNVYLYSVPTPPLLSDTYDVWPVVQDLYQWLMITLSASSSSASEEETARLTPIIAPDEQRLNTRRSVAGLAIAYRRSSARLRATMQDCLRDFQLQWEALCLDQNERNRFRGNAVQKALFANHAQEHHSAYDETMAFTGMMRDVRRCWPLLDVMAQRRWLAVWQHAMPSRRGLLLPATFRKHD